MITEEKLKLIRGFDSKANPEVELLQIAYDGGMHLPDPLSIYKWRGAKYYITNAVATEDGKWMRLMGKQALPNIQKYIYDLDMLEEQEKKS